MSIQIGFLGYYILNLPQLKLDILMIMFIPYFILIGDKLNSHKVILIDDNKIISTERVIDNLNINYCKIKQKKEKVINL